MKNKLSKVARETNLYLKSYIIKQKKSNLIEPIKYGLFSGGKKIRSKILVDIGKIFKVNYKTLIKIGAAIECVHAYSLIHDDLPCMDNDVLRRGKPSTHIKYGESTAVLAGNSLLTMAFEILTEKNLNISEKIKIELIKNLSECTGHTGVAGGQYLDLYYEKKKVSVKKVINMQIKKTGKLFSFCCMAPLVIKNKDAKVINFFNNIGSDIGLLFQVTDDLLDFKGNTNYVGKRTKKDKKRGKATIIDLLGYKKTIKYCDKIKFNLFKKLNKYGSRSNDIQETIEYISIRNK